MMSKRARQYIGILFAIMAYYIVHEGAHLIAALALHAFKKINFMGIGIQIDIYRDRLTDTQLGIFCIAEVTATLITAYFAFLLLFNIWILIKKVNPTYTASFKER